MLRVKLSKLRQVCATAFIPSILKETKTLKRNDKYSIKYWNKALKSTDSSSKDDNYEKRKRILDKCFAEKTPVLDEFDKDTNAESLMKDKANLCESTTVDKTKAFTLKVLEKDKHEEIKTDQDLRNAKVLAVAAKIEEVKLAHDIIHNSRAENGATLLQNTHVETSTENTNRNMAEENKPSEIFGLNEKTPHIRSDGTNTEEPGTPIVLLQNSNIQSTIGNNKGDKEKLAHNTVHIDKTPYVEAGANKGEHLNTTKEASKVPENSQSQNTAANVEKEAQHVVYINKTQHVDIDKAKKATTAKVESEKLTQHSLYFDKTPPIETGISGLDAAPKVLDALQDAKVQAATQKVKEEKLSLHIVPIDKTPLVNPKFSESVQSTCVQATTAKTKEEKLAQKIDHIDETPHVEAAVPRVEGFNVPPNILGHDANTNVSVSEPSSFSIQQEQVNLDELAKKCLGKPDGDIDQILLRELKNMSRANSIKFDLPKHDSSQKYFSQIFENKTKDNNNIVFDISNTHLEPLISKDGKDFGDNMKLDKIHPFHLDTVPLVTTDTRDYKDEYKRNYSPEDIRNNLLNIPAVFDPYDMEAIPFYQYVSKENIALQELPQPNTAPIHEPSPAEPIQEIETNVPMNEEVILKRDDASLQEPPINNKLKELVETEPLDRETATAYTAEPLPEGEDFSNSKEIPTLSESDVSKLLEYKNVLSAQEEAIRRMSPNNVSSEFTPTATDTEQPQPPHILEDLEDASQTVLTSSIETPTDAYGNPVNSEPFQDKFPTSYQADAGIQPQAQHTDTAISANQEPDEYFPTTHLNSTSSIEHTDYVVTDNCVTYSGVFDTKSTCTGDNAYDTENESLMSQSIFYYSTFPQLSGFKSHSDDAKHLNVNDPISHVFIQPQPEREYLRQKMAEPKREQVMEAAVTKDVDSTSYTEDTIPLSVLLRRVRERNRLEVIKSIKTNVELTKKSTCIPPLDGSQPKVTLKPNPCQVKPKEKEDPRPCKQPEKKDPCAKFSPFILSAFLRSNLDVSIPPKTIYEQIYTYVSLAKEFYFTKIKQLSPILGFLNIKHSGDKTEDVVCARDFDPWVPIPSWPIPIEEKKRRLVTPKSGCKLPVHPVRSNTDKPCLGMPKKISPTKTLINPWVIHGI